MKASSESKHIRSAFRVPASRSRRCGTGTARTKRTSLCQEETQTHARAQRRTQSQTHARSESESRSESSRAARESRRPPQNPTRVNSYGLRWEEREREDARAAYPSKGKSNIVSERTLSPQSDVDVDDTHARGYGHQILKLSAVASAAADPYSRAEDCRSADARHETRVEKEKETETAREQSGLRRSPSTALRAHKH